MSVLAIRAFSEDFAERRKQRAEKKAAWNSKKRKTKQARSSKEADDDAPKTAEEVTVAADEDNSKKRKAEEPEDDSSTAKKLKEESHPTTNGVDNDVKEVAKSADEAIDPSEASKAPDGKRPDDKLRSSMRILDALSATGLRALRYASELPLPVFVTANDLLAKATAAIKLNAQHNKLSSKIQATTSNAQAHMYNAAFGFSSHAYAKYDVIDLDPYGTAVPFLEAALLATNDNGMLCVTCTDAGVFNSMGYLEKTYALYGGIPVKGGHAHEAGLRLIINAIATSASKHGLAIEPLLSLSIDYYARVFVRVRHSPAEVKFLASKTMTVASCDAGCGSWAVQPLSRVSVAKDTKGGDFNKYHPAQISTPSRCDQCGSRTHLAGPMWGGPLHNPSFINRILSYLPSLDKETYVTTERIDGMLTTALDELAVLPSIPQSTETTGIIPPLPPQLNDPHPFSFSVSALSRVLHCQAPPEAAIKGALRHMGYVATRSHAKPGMIKTEAPWSAIWDIMRAWVAERAPVKAGSVREGSAGWAILNPKKDQQEENKDVTGKEEKKVQFDERLGRDEGRKLVRYQMNPRDNWGPMSRAKG